MRSEGWKWGERDSVRGQGSEAVGCEPRAVMWMRGKVK